MIFLKTYEVDEKMLKIIDQKENSVTIEFTGMDISDVKRRLANGLLFERIQENEFMKAEHAAEQHENEIVSAMGSFLGDD